jgi:REP element-mobilizing transposase RayT
LLEFAQPPFTTYLKVPLRCAKSWQLRKQLWARELWEDGYFARTVGDNVTADVIRRYIRQPQGETGRQRQLKLF